MEAVRGGDGGWHVLRCGKQACTDSDCVLDSVGVVGVYWYPTQ